MKNLIANFISIIFHPVVFAMLAPFLVLYHSTNNAVYGLEWAGFSFLFVFSAMLVLYLIRPKDFFKDFDISKREKRPLFYSISLFFALLYFSIAVFLKSILFPLSLVSLGIILGLVIFEFANQYIKVSVHAAVSSGFVITFGLLYGPMAFLLVFWIPFVVAWSRLVLHKHTRPELLSGSALGCVITLITFAVAELLV